MAAERSFRFCIFMIFCCGLTEHGTRPSKTRCRRTEWRRHAALVCVYRQTRYCSESCSETARLESVGSLTGLTAFTFEHFPSVLSLNLFLLNTSLKIDGKRKTNPYIYEPQSIDCIYSDCAI